ncbi:hypothetical protein H0H81_011551 [Sphagnurus paluster]|uniref:Beta-hexosaminidase eukaryotic type N-terminal domain-containing protein n=1 Tax=Sphagnurus paluster TaxID=117069 RepID=A0A9P7FUH5_9AGAR|nr:hypothetical protein H0H81_011551 [Sphagnurus paluster]
MFSFVVVAVLLAVTPSLAVWPIPQKYTTGSTALRLSPSFSIKLSGINPAPQDLLAAISRTSDHLRKDKLQALVPDRGASSANAVRAAKALDTLTVSLTSNAKVRSIAEEAVDDIESRVEGYELTIPANGSGATLKANSSLGLLRGLTTFTQLWYNLDETTYTLEAPFTIVDAPAYPYRGLMLDTARN